MPDNVYSFTIHHDPHAVQRGQEHELTDETLNEQRTVEWELGWNHLPTE